MSPRTAPRWLSLAALALALLASACVEDSPVVPQDAQDADTQDDAEQDTDAPDDAGEDDDAADVPIKDDPDAEQDADPTPRSCQTDEDCDDGLPCTADACGPAGSCQWSPAPNACFIGGRCYTQGESSPRDPCLACERDQPTQWTLRPLGAPCDDGDACTADELCTRDGRCVGAALSCDDGDPCTDDACDPALGCTAPPSLDGARCDDGNPCTTGDACLGGRCQGDGPDCDDGNPCTDDTCGPDGGCAHTPNAAPCDDGDACTTGEACQGGACVQGATPANCDDGNICTIDGCDARAGCYNLPTESPCCLGEVSVCDDGDPCTSDLCDPASGACLYEDNAARCDDRSACTEGDTCQAGRCVGRPIACDDTNACTEDRCLDAQGCVHVQLTGTACDDGVACTSQDACDAGVCAGDDSTCTCDPTFGSTAAKFTQARIGASNAQGEAIDLDGNGTRDNAMGALAPLVNAPIQESIEGGSFILLLDFLRFDRNPFTLAAYDGALAPSDADCALQSAVCDYEVSANLLDPDTCAPEITLPATRANARVLAGGPQTRFLFQIPFGDTLLSLTLYGTKLEADLQLQGDQVQRLSGVLGGAIRKPELLAALRQLPPGSLPFEVDAIAPLLDFVIPNDIDTDGDGSPDAASLCIPFNSIGANLVGVRR